VFVDFNILNQLGSPSINSNTFANRPAAGQTGRLFVSTDTFEIYRDNGTTWDLIGSGSAGISGSGTATQVAYFTGATAIGSSANLYWDNTNTRLGIGTSSPGARLDIHGTGNILQLNATGATANTLMSFQRLGSNVWRLGEQYAGGFNYFEIHNAVLANNAVQFEQANNKATFSALETYSSGGATGSLFSYTITVPGGTNFTGPNVIGNVNSALILNFGGNTTVPNSARQGLEGNSRINFTGAGTLTMTQGTGTVRAFSALSSVYSFSGSAVGTITHLAGYRACFPDNIGSAVNITNNYAILINDQTTGTGTVTYTNRWGIYQEGASDLNYFNGNLLIKSTTNTGEALQVNGTAIISSNITANSFIPTGSGVPVNGLYLPASNSIGFATNTTARMRIDASGNIGLGVIPSAWGAAYVAQQLGTRASISNGPSGQTFLGNNVYSTASNWVYLQTAASSLYEQFAGGHTWYNVASGTAGTNITFTTQMNLNSSGNLGINTTTIGSRLQVNGNAAIGYSASTAAPTNGLIVAGQVGVGVSPAVGFIIDASASGDQSIRVSTTSTGLNANAAIRLNATTEGSWLLQTGNSGAGSLRFYDSNAGADRMRILSTGDVVINTTTSAGKVTIQPSNNAVGLSLNGSSLTGANAQSLVDLSQTWNTTGNPTAIKLNVTNTASGATAYLMDLQVGAATQFRVTKAGAIRTAAPTTGTANDWKLGTRVAAVVALDTTQYIELEVGGTLYKLAIVT